MQFLDLALILVANIVLSIGAVLYYGGVSVPKLSASLVIVF